MKTQIVTIVAATILALIAFNGMIKQSSHANSEDLVVFERWAQDHKKFYSSPAEKQFRYAVFLKKLAEVKRVNISQDSYTFVINKFSDITQEEAEIKYFGYKANLAKEADAPKKDSSELTQVPDEIDWRTKGAVTYVKDQQHCGSCWAFSATGTVESAYFLKYGTLNRVSEQQLVDCSWLEGNMGCHGGLPQNAFKYMHHKEFINGDYYFYMAEDGVCQYNKWKSKAIGKLSGHESVKDTEDDLKASVAARPTSVGVYAVPWLQYGGGIFNDVKNCPAEKRKIDHAVLAVGYGTDKGQDFWIIKNSWGQTWGESGYIRLGRNMIKGGLCGVALEAHYAIVH